MKEKIELLIDDLNKSIKARKEDGTSYFSEELVILRLKEILKEGASDETV